MKAAERSRYLCEWDGKKVRKEKLWKKVVMRYLKALPELSSGGRKKQCKYVVGYMTFEADTYQRNRKYMWVPHQHS
jgi:hypothetical protein